ncbi:hypothetical protein GCM10007973_13340 [Polymorphobacter multimanifer]|nr:hypothetical protein GCM10007973_13340 [Polymorphobacter multimanifer]
MGDGGAHQRGAQPALLGARGDRKLADIKPLGARLPEHEACRHAVLLGDPEQAGPVGAGEGLGSVGPGIGKAIDMGAAEQHGGGRLDGGQQRDVGMDGGSDHCTTLA